MTYITNDNINRILKSKREWALNKRDEVGYTLLIEDVLSPSEIQTFLSLGCEVFTCSWSSRSQYYNLTNCGFSSTVTMDSRLKFNVFIEEMACILGRKVFGSYYIILKNELIEENNIHLIRESLRAPRLPTSSSKLFPISEQALSYGELTKIIKSSLDEFFGENPYGIVFDSHSGIFKVICVTVRDAKKYGDIGKYYAAEVEPTDSWIIKDDLSGFKAKIMYEQISKKFYKMKIPNHFYYTYETLGDIINGKV